MPGGPMMLRSHLISTATTARAPSLAEGYKPLIATSVPGGGSVQLASN